MTQEKFNELWNKSLIPFSEIIENKTRVLFDKNQKNTIHQVYEKIKKDQKKLMRNPEGPLDRHKVGALIAHAILKVCPFEIMVGDHYSFYQRTANEMFAIFTGIQIIRDFVIAESLKNDDATTVKIFKTKFVFPEPVRSKEKYLNYLIRTLYRARIGNECNISLLANAFYVLERYHDRVVRENMRSSLV